MRRDCGIRFMRYNIRLLVLKFGCFAIKTEVLCVLCGEVLSQMEERNEFLEKMDE